MSAFGRDLKTVVDANGNVDITPGMLESTGRAVLAERLVRRQTTPRGSVIDAPNECFDIREWLSKEFNDANMSKLRGTIKQELLNDVGVLTVDVVTTYDAAKRSFKVVESVVSSDGPFVLTLSVSQLSIDVLVSDR
jgi:hypothetical protein